ncbi:diphthine Sase [Nucleospora cyclopteri]
MQIIIMCKINQVNDKNVKLSINYFYTQRTMLYIIGTGLNDYRDISLRSIEILKKCDKIYLEHYTCILNTDLEEIVGQKVIIANRKLVEETDLIVLEAKEKEVAFLVVGTPLFATTHIDILERAKSYGVSTKVIHNVSIASVKGCFGLYSYNFGRCVSICYFEENWKPLSFYDNILTNYKNGMHTLCLLDIKTDENRFMSGNEAINQLLYAEKEKEQNLFTLKTKLFVVCRFATDEEAVFYGTAEELLKKDFGKPLHSLIIPGPLSIIEKEFIEKMFLN